MEAQVLIEMVGFVAAFFTTSAFLPQVLKIRRTKQTKALSLTMLSMQFTGNILWMIYGLLILSPALIVANIVTTSLVGWIIFLKWYYEYK